MFYKDNVSVVTIQLERMFFYCIVFYLVFQNATRNPQLSRKSILEGDTNASVRAKLGEMPPREIELAVGTLMK